MKRTDYLVLFRGVGGKTQLPVAQLREKLTQAGFEHVATCINSGNAIVRSGLNRQQVIAMVAELCRKHFPRETGTPSSNSPNSVASRRRSAVKEHGGLRESVDLLGIGHGQQ